MIINNCIPSVSFDTLLFYFLNVSFKMLCFFYLVRKYTNKHYDVPMPKMNHSASNGMIVRKLIYKKMMYK